MTKTVLITGANRGLGLKFVKQYAQDGWLVIAVCRSPNAAKELNELADLHENITLYTLDVSNQTMINDLAEQLHDRPIDLLLNNAGIYGSFASTIDSIDEQEMIRAFQVNTLAPLNLITALLPNLELGNVKKIASITSKMGSISDNTSGGSYPYRASKAALNMTMKSVSIELAPKNITVLMLHPGWVQTDMGGPNALISPQESIRGMRKVIDEADLERSGRFLTYNGEELAW